MEPNSILLDIAFILLAARIFGEIAIRINVPPIIGELVAGIVLGPSLLGWVEPNDVLALLAEIGIILLLFEVGLETDIGRLVKAGCTGLRFKLLCIQPLVAGVTFYWRHTDSNQHWYNGTCPVGHGADP